ncbi:MAG: T9SS type A sorting domain-containing protein, partial [Bacteroidales bacterium]|nr:T9SS type A sorting domain-containing protein [Bacteroidales bacterium]
DNLSLTDFDSTYYVFGELPLDVQFYNYSIGSINTNEWDFNNDGIADSYEENPVFIYPDTGWHSVKLTVYDEFDTNSFLRENYVYVYELTGVEDVEENTFGFSYYPNPFNDKITFTFSNKGKANKNEILIYDMNGSVINRLNSGEKELIWDGTNSTGSKCEPGVYLVKSKKYEISKKIILTN